MGCATWLCQQDENLCNAKGRKTVYTEATFPIVMQPNSAFMCIHQNYKVSRLSCKRHHALQEGDNVVQ